MTQPLPRKVVLVADQGMGPDRDEHAALLRAAAQLRERFRAASPREGKPVTAVQFVLSAIIGTSLGVFIAAGVMWIFKIPKIF